MTAPLSIRNLHAGYDGVPVVRDVTFDVEAGEIMALLGPNGAGKTTTLLAISGICSVLSGEVRAFGQTLEGLAPQERARLGIAHVPEGRALFPTLTVAEHIKLAAGRHKTQARMAFELFPELEVIASRRAALLSGGEQQMVALARALVSEPRILMVDEMSLGLAPLIVQRLLATVRRVADETGCAVLLVEQHVQLALAAADRACVLSHGEVHAAGASHTFVERPDVLEAAYLGATMEVASWG